MSFSRLSVLSILFVSFTASPLLAQTGSKLNVIKGPGKAKMENFAQIDVPEGYAFLDAKSTKAMMKASGEPTSGREVGFMAPTNDEFGVYFEFSPVGYVKDDDKAELD